MTEKEYEALYEALLAADRLLAGAEDCDKKDAELRKKIRKLEKAVLKRQKKAARAGREGKKPSFPSSKDTAAENSTGADLATKASA